MTDDQNVEQALQGQFETLQAANDEEKKKIEELEDFLSSQHSTLQFSLENLGL